jgi:hypothetical protein
VVRGFLRNEKGNQVAKKNKKNRTGNGDADIGAATESEGAAQEDSGHGGTAMGRTSGLAFGGSTANQSKKAESSEDTSAYKEMKGGRRTGVKGGAKTGGNAGGGDGSTGGKGKKRASKAGSKGSSKGGAGKGGSRGGEGGRGGATRPAFRAGPTSGEQERQPGKSTKRRFANSDAGNPRKGGAGGAKNKGGGTRGGQGGGGRK